MNKPRINFRQSMRSQSSCGFFAPFILRVQQSSPFQILRCLGLTHPGITGFAVAWLIAIPTLVSAEPLPTKPQRVGVVGAAPFVVREDTKISGISVEIWNRIARSKGIEYQLKTLDAIAKGDLDMAIGPISITAKRLEENVAFTLPYFLSEISVLTSSQEPSVWSRLKPFFGTAVVTSIGILIVLLALTTELYGFALPVNSPLLHDLNIELLRLAVTDIYCPANVAMVSPTSTSTAISGDCFFRTVPSDQESADRLANYIAQSNVTDPVVFYASNSSYSRSLKDAFEQETSLEEVAASDLSQSAFNASPEVRKYVQNGAKVALLFPSTTWTSRAIAVARVNQALDPNQQMQIIGNDALYSDETLAFGKKAVEGMVLTAPWYPNTPYAQQAAERWNTQVSWRTAYSYDAAKALLAAIKTADSREGVLQALRQVSLPASETAGDELKFDAEGNRVGASVQLVQIVPTDPSTTPSDPTKSEEDPTSLAQPAQPGFTFELLK